MSEEYLDEATCSARYGVSRRTLQRWRILGEGPPFVRMGLRKVAYRVSDCEAWAKARTFPHRAAEYTAKTAK
jgi:predicted DNA-binding transcriptional regulator AlpA